MIIHNPILTGSFTVNGTDVASITSSAASITALNSYTASQNILNGTYTLTSSFAAQTASFTAFTSSVNSFTASQLVLNGTYATTGSNTFKNPQTINSNLTVTGSITAQTLIVSTINATQSYSSGSNIFGNNIANTQTFTGSLLLTGSATFNGALTAGATILNGNLNVGSGSVSSAAVNINSNPSTAAYLYFNGAGITNNHTAITGLEGATSNLKFYTANTTRLTIDSAGAATFGSSVIINSSSLLKLGNSDNASTMQIWNSQSGAANNLLVYDNAASAYRFVINSSGNVGIGTSSPTNILSFGNTAAQKIWIENTAADVAGKALTISAGSTIAGSALPNVAGGTLTLQAGLGTGTTGTSQILFQTGQSLGGGATLMGYTTRMAVLNGFAVTVANAVPTTLFNIASTINVGSMALVTVYATSGSGLGMATLIIMRDGYGGVSQAQLGTQPTANYLSFSLSGTNLQITVALGSGNHDIKGSIVMIAS
jgi:hypothetical protein